MTPIETAAKLIHKLYNDLGQAAGGPLHWILDDGNIQDDQIAERPGLYDYLFDGTYDRWADAGDDVSDEHKQAIKETCELILNEFRQMPEKDRAAAITMSWKSTATSSTSVPRLSVNTPPAVTHDPHRKDHTMTEDEIAKAAYETWDAYGGRALGDWNQQYCREAWAHVVTAVRESLRDGPPAELYVSPEDFADVFAAIHTMSLDDLRKVEQMNPTGHPVITGPALRAFLQERDAAGSTETSP